MRLTLFTRALWAKARNLNGAKVILTRLHKHSYTADPWFFFSKFYNQSDIFCSEQLIIIYDWNSFAYRMTLFVLVFGLSVRIINRKAEHNLCFVVSGFVLQCSSVTQTSHYTQTQPTLMERRGFYLIIICRILFSMEIWVKSLMHQNVTALIKVAFRSLFPSLFKMIFFRG